MPDQFLLLIVVSGCNTFFNVGLLDAMTEFSAEVYKLEYLDIILYDFDMVAFVENSV